MRLWCFVLLSASCLAQTASPRVPASEPAELPMTVYVGTYTDTASKGIYRFTLDPVSGAASEPVLAAETAHPSFLALHPNGRVLYAVNEIGGSGQEPGGLVSAFAVDAKTGDLTLLNQQPSHGGSPCHLVVDRGGRHVLVANYGGGNVAVLPIAADGRLQPASDVRAHEGTGPNPRRQRAPHAHGLALDPSGTFAVATDLGADRLFVYRYDAEKGVLAPHGTGRGAPGAGPRHAVFGSQGRVLYTIDELTSTATVFDVGPDPGTLTAVQSTSTLPAGFTGESWTAELALSPDGRHAYGSNRGHDSLAVFAVEGRGRLVPQGHVAAGGKTPRHFAIDESGRWLLVANQASDGVALFRLDAASGRPTFTGTVVGVPKPVCVLVVPAPSR